MLRKANMGVVDVWDELDSYLVVLWKFERGRLH